MRLVGCQRKRGRPAVARGAWSPYPGTRPWGNADGPALAGEDAAGGATVLEFGER